MGGWGETKILAYTPQGEGLREITTIGKIKRVGKKT